MLCKTLGLIGLLLLAGCSGGDGAGRAKEMESSGFREGDAWSYSTRPGEEESIVFIGRIEDLGGHPVVHIQIQGISLRNPQVVGGIQRELGHLPISVEALSSSVTAKTTGHLNRESFEEGYAVWQENRGGVFTLTIVELIDLAKSDIQK